MAEEIPSIAFDNKRGDLEIEIMTFNEVNDKIVKIDDHDPFAPHKLTFYFIVIVTKGELEHFVDFKTYKLQKGSALFVAKNQVHHFTPSFSNTEGFCIILNSTYLEHHYFLPGNIKFNRLYNYHLEEPVIHQQDMGNDSFSDVAQKMYEEYNFPNTFAKQEILRAYVHIMLLKAERAKEKKTNFGVQANWLEIFTRFKNKLEAEYLKTRSSRYYASELNITYKFLNDVVKKLTHKTIKIFIDEFVITEIKRYLVSTSLSLKEIAYKTGFDEPTNFTKFFKKYTNLTPAQFRHSIK